MGSEATKYHDSFAAESRMPSDPISEFGSIAYSMPRMGRRRWRICALILALCLSMGLQAANVLVFAAASLADALKEIGVDHAAKSGDKIVFNFGASSTLARQIEEGAPADIFFSADEPKMDALEQKGRIVNATRKNLLSNSLVVVTAADSSLALLGGADLAGPSVKRLALADPKAVPAGVYAKVWLEKIRLWPQVSPKVVPTENVRAALAAVESGNVEAGIVYKTDAAISRKVRVAFEVPVAEGPAIRYPVALTVEAKEPDAAKGFLKQLESDAAVKVFEKFGFVVLRLPSNR